MADWYNKNSAAYSLCSHYPYNLLRAVKGNTMLQLPAAITMDVQQGLLYALSTLSEKERIILEMRYIEEKDYHQVALTIEESAEQCKNSEMAALKKLRHPSRWEFIQHGISGLMKKRITEAQHKAYREGYYTGILDAKSGIAISSAPETIQNLPIAVLGLSSRAENCLSRAGYSRIGEVAELHADAILKIRNLGKKQQPKSHRLSGNMELHIPFGTIISCNLDCNAKKHPGGCR